MAFHQLELLGGQTSGFIEDRVGDRDFPDVMHGSRVADNLDHIAVEAVLRFLLPQRFQKQLGDIAYPRDMLARFAAAELYRCAQCVNEELVGPAQFAGLLLNLVDLLGDCPFQLAAVVIKLNDILDTPFDQLLIEGLGDQVGDAKTVNLDTEPFARFCGNHDDWNIMVFIFNAH